MGMRRVPEDPEEQLREVSWKDCFAPLMSTGAEKKDAQKIVSNIDSGKEGAINEHQNIVTKVLFRSLLKTGGYPTTFRMSIHGMVCDVRICRGT